MTFANRSAFSNQVALRRRFSWCMTASGIHSCTRISPAACPRWSRCSASSRTGPGIARYCTPAFPTWPLTTCNRSGRRNPRAPTSSGGMRLGGRLAFEMALQLEAQGLDRFCRAIRRARAPDAAQAWLTQQRHWARFVTTVRDTEGASGLRRVLDASAKAARKLRNFSLTKRPRGPRCLSTLAPIPEPSAGASTTGAVPGFAQGLSVPTVLSFARHQDYKPLRLLEGKAHPLPPKRTAKRAKRSYS